jgi:hypothetical protein
VYPEAYLTAAGPWCVIHQTCSSKKIEDDISL